MAVLMCCFALQAQTAGATWKNDVPSATVFYNAYFAKNKNTQSFKTELNKRGYKFKDGYRYVKSGVCSFHFINESGSKVIDIKVTDKTVYRWLLNDIKNFCKTHKSCDFDDYGDEIMFVYSSY